MKYLCLIYDDETTLYALPKHDMERLIKDHLAFDRDLAQSGYLLGTNALERVSAATTVRVRQGKVWATDGPFAETKEQLGGYYLIEARDLNEAIQVAARIPSARRGSVEVRPVREHFEA